ncbi:putative cullin family protein [Rosellinia necatrix]|uniref:Anaphase-promoting complex subunit 2 n=1 Tax=Rosellinia necatrix TaxID=77044 RepID=A0A1W2TPE2_ROSNE|nr:putative cullin family protein [Rosellinia necatrix]
MATVDTKWHTRRRRAVHSVFPTDSFSQPTPNSTPSARFASQGQPFGGALSREQAQQSPTPHKWAMPVPVPVPVPVPMPMSVSVSVSVPVPVPMPMPSVVGELPRSTWSTSPESTHAAHQTRLDRAWHAVTARIALPASVSAEDSFGPLPSPQDIDDGTFEDALLDVLDPASRLPLARHTEDVLAWHTQQVRQHVVSHVLPLLAVCDSYQDRTQALLGSVRTLEAAHRQYLYGLSLITRPMKSEQAELALKKFQRDLHAIVGNSMSTNLVASLRTVLGQMMKTVLGIRSTNSTVLDGKKPERHPNDVDHTREELIQLVDSLCKVGLAGERFQILFAELLDGMMIAYVQQSFAGDWGSMDQDVHMLDSVTSQQQSYQPRCILQLSDWVENHYARLAVEVTNRLGAVEVSWTDVEKWKETAIGRLATLRINELFDIVINWPNSEGGIEDLRFAVTTPQRRLQLTDAFSAALQDRLLHPGRSTLEILRTYIAMIRTFHKLDHSRVLLDRVAYSLQLYLCTREDTVRIIVSGLLSTPKDVDSEARVTKLVELVELLYDPDQYRSERQDEEWDDLTWVPPPVDAGSNYKRRKSEDVIGTLISALGSPEVFIKEFQNIIGERLLSEQISFDQEIGVLDLLKKRFGEPSLQACDVMIKDIQDSRRLDGIIHRGVLNQPAKVSQIWNIHAKILSRLYWPEVGEDNFDLPPAVATMQKTYASIFEHLKPARKLKWLNHLGHATVELELEDRTITADVRTYEAAVINAFGEENASGWTFEDLWMKLQIDEDLLTAALQLWENKDVLRKQRDGRYVVVERLSDVAESPLAGQYAAPSMSAATADASQTPPRRAKPGMSEKEKEKRGVYWQFIVGMLTNSSPAMPLNNIAMMMKMLIPDGFPWSNEELQEFLAEKLGDGELELVGGKYKLIKK